MTLQRLCCVNVVCLLGGCEINEITCEHFIQGLTTLQAKTDLQILEKIKLQNFMTYKIQFPTDQSLLRWNEKALIGLDSYTVT